MGYTAGPGKKIPAKFLAGIRGVFLTIKSWHTILPLHLELPAWGAGHTSRIPFSHWFSRNLRYMLHLANSVPFRLNTLHTCRYSFYHLFLYYESRKNPAIIIASIDQKRIKNCTTSLSADSTGFPSLSVYMLQISVRISNTSQNHEGSQCNYCNQEPQHNKHLSFV